MPSEKVVHWYVPLPTELKPVTRVPPVAVKMTVGKAGDLREGAQNVLEDDEENEQKCDHEGEEEEGYTFREDEKCFGFGTDIVEAERGVVEDRHDELFASNGEKEDAAKHSEGLPEELEVLRSFGAGVFELVAEGRAKDVVGVIGEGQVLWVCNGAKGGGKLEGEIFADLGKRIFFILMNHFLFECSKFAQVGAGAWVADDGCCGGVLWVV